MDSPQGVEQGQGENGQKEHGGGNERLRGKFKAEFEVELHDFHQQQAYKLVEGESQPDTQHEADRRRIQRLVGNNASDMFFLHAQNVEQSEFLFAAFDKEAVRIKQEYHREYPDHVNTEAQCRLQRSPAVHVGKRAAVGERRHNEEHCHSEHRGDEIGNVGPRVFAYILRGEPCIEHLTHRAHHPSRSS